MQDVNQDTEGSTNPKHDSETIGDFLQEFLPEGFSFLFRKLVVTKLFIELSSLSSTKTLVVIGLNTFTEFFQRNFVVIHHTHSFLGLDLVFLFVGFICRFRNSSFILGIGFLVLTGLVNGLSTNVVSILTTIFVHTALSVGHLALSVFSDCIIQLEGLSQFFECTNN